MSIEHVREYGAAAAAQPRWALPQVTDGLGALARWWQGMALKRRAVGVERIRVDEMSAYLLRDIGLPPDLR